LQSEWDTTQGGAVDHFSVVVRHLDNGNYYGIDTTNGILTLWQAQELARNFSGYCLLADRRTDWVGKVNKYILGAALLTAVVNASLVVRRRAAGIAK